MRKVYDLARADLGLAEIAGGRHNPKIVQMFADIGQAGIKDDETSWCAAFVGSKLKASGLPHTSSAAARSYLKWGEAVALKDAQPGDVVVFWRNDPSSWQGHVGFFHAINGSNIEVLGGNQSNQVSIARYPINRLLGIRRMAMAAPTTPPASGNPIAALIALLLKLFGGRK